MDSLYYKFGQLKMIEELLNKESYSELMLNVLMDEALSTTAIEGGAAPAIFRPIVHQSTNC